jgi:Fe-S-cluster containining protein
MSNENETPRCMRTGGCCKNLVATNTLEYVQKMQEMGELDRYRGNYTPDFMEKWKQAAEMAVEAKRVVFTCPFLEGDNVCMLQDKKPGICAYSLSESMLSRYTSLSENHFFSSKCGYLKGAPPALVNVIEKREALYAEEEGSKVYTELLADLDKAQIEYEQTTRAYIHEGKWVIEYRSSVVVEQTKE